jgi:hypothetical protein
MNYEEFNVFCQQLDKDSYDVMDKAKQEYASNAQRFSNFDHASQRLRRNPRLTYIKPSDVALVFLDKHIDSLMSGISLREDIRGRIIDIINYMKLYAGMIEEENKAEVVPAYDFSEHLERYHKIRTFEFSQGDDADL